jgi:hypothetical protein
MTLVTEISREQTCNRDSVSVTRVLDVEPYASWYDMCSLLLGGVRLVGGFLYRVPPLTDPYLPWAFCKTVRVEGIGTFHGTGAAVPAIQLASRNYYRRARLHVTYESLQQTEQEMNNAAGQNGGQSDAQEIELASQSIDVSAQQLTLPNKYFKWRYSPNLSLAQQGVNATKTIPQMKTVLVRHFVITRPLNAIAALIGRVNYSSFRVGTATWPPETLRFDGAVCNQKITNLGVKFHEIQYTFAVLPVYDDIALSTETYSPGNPNAVVTPSTKAKAWVGWNRVYNPARGHWDRPVQVGDPLKGVYEYDNAIYQNLVGGAVSGFRLLFHPGAL